MRVTYLLTSLGMGGAERLALALAERMAERGHVVQILVLGSRVEQEWETELPVVRLGFGKNPISFAAGLWRARQALKGFQPDLIHSHCFHSNLVARLMRVFGSSARVISTVHNVYEGPRNRMLAYRVTDRLADGVVFVCRAALDRYTGERAVNLHKAHVILNGIDTDAWKPDHERRRQTRQLMGLGEEFVWLSAGRLTDAKDFPGLLSAFALLRPMYPEVRLWIAGEGSAQKTAELRKLTETLGLKQDVRWLGARKDLSVLMDAADGFVLGSAWEGMPLVLGEAMALELPVVATDVGGVRELVGEEGSVVPAGSPEALAEAMRQTMESGAAQRHLLGVRARQRIESGFRLDVWTDQWEAFYRELFATTREEPRP